MPNRSPDFRFIFANVLGFQFSDNDLRLLFAIDEGEGVETALEQVGVVMTHKTAKLLGRTLIEIITNYEAKTGSIIPLDPDKLKGIQDMLEGANLPSASDSGLPS